MATTYRETKYPDPPANLPAEARKYLQDLVNAMRKGESDLVRGLNEGEPYAQLEVLGVAPDRLVDGREYEVDAVVGAASPFGAGAGRYIVRAGVPVFIG